MNTDIIEYKSHNKSTKFKKLNKYYKRVNLKNTIYNKKMKRKIKKNYSIERADKYRIINEYDHVCTHITCCKDEYPQYYDYCRYQVKYKTGYLTPIGHLISCDDHGYAYLCNIMYMRWVKKKEKNRKKVGEIVLRYEKLKQKMNGKITKNILVKFFCNILPKLFNVKIFANSVMSLISNVDCNVIELVFHSNYHKKKLIKTMKKIFFSEFVEIKSEIPYIWHVHPRVIRDDVVSFLLNICGTSIKFVIVHEYVLCIYPLVFIEQCIRWDSSEFTFFKPEYHCSQYIGYFSGKYINFFKTSYVEKCNNDINFNVNIINIKENLENKRLTLRKNIIVDDDIENYSICEQRLNFIRAYHERISEGYTINEPCPKNECVIQKQSILEFCKIIFDSTQLIFAVSCLVFEYLYLKINDKDICTYCGEVFEDGLFLMVPQCDCGKKIYNDNDDATYNNHDNSLMGFSKYCGWRQNYNNVFHMQCFISIATQMRLDKDYQECICCDCNKYFALQ